MKRTLFLSLIGSLALCSSAQLVVNPRGQLVAGKENQLTGIGSEVNGVGPAISSTIENGLDSLAQVVVLGKGNQNSGGYISFGNGSNVTVGEKYLASPTWPRYNILTLKGTGA